MSEANQSGTKGLLHFGVFTLNLERRGLYKDEERVRLTAKPLETLIFLVENHGRVVEKRELLKAVWKDTYVSEDTLVHAIREIRRALGDDRENPRYIQTVPREGYRFVCEVKRADAVSKPIESVAPQPSQSTLQVGTRIPRWLFVAVPAVVLVSIGIWFYWSRPVTNQTKPFDERTIAGGLKKQITSGEFSSGKPIFSPDGKHILYVSSEEQSRGYGDLFVRQYPEGKPQRITNKINPSGDLPVFTGDGEHVVFSLPRIAPDGARHHDLWTTLSSGGPPSRYIEDASGAGFSPDQRWVAYTKQLPSKTALWVSSVNKVTEFFEISDGGYTPRWSPNGEWLAYTTSNPNEGVGAIWICKVAGASDGKPTMSDQRRVTNENEQMYGLSWTPDSKSIIFSSKRTGPSQLFKVTIENGQTTPLLVGLGEYGAPSVSPDGNVVIFQYYRLTNDLKMATPSADCKAKNLTFDEFHRWPRISPGGERLVSVIRQIDDSERLVLTDLKSKESSQLSTRTASYPCWLSPDKVAFLSPDSSGQGTEVLVINISTREAAPLIRFPDKSEWLAMHPDGRRLAIVLTSPDGRERIVVRDTTNNAETTIHEGSEYEYLRWSPDGTALSWDKPGASRNAPQVSAGVWMIVLAEMQPRFVARDGYCPVWSQDGGAIYYGMRHDKQGLWRHDLKKQSDQLVCPWESVFTFDLNGGQLVFAQHKNDSQIYSLSLRP